MKKFMPLVFLLSLLVVMVASPGFAAVCAAPASVTVPATDADGSYLVRWSASVTGGVSYIAEEATNSTFTAGLRTVYTGTGLSTAITGAVRGKTYWYRVKAWKRGSSDSVKQAGGNGVVVPLPLPVGQPASLTVPATDADGAYLVRWGASATEGVTYTLEEATDQSFTFVRVAYTGVALKKAIALRTLGTKYWYRVKAKKSGNPDSAWRFGANGCQVGDTQVGQPASLLVPATDADGTYTVSWGASAMAGVTYTLEESADPDFTSVRVAYAGTSLATGITGRLGTYYYRVKATKAGLTDSLWLEGGNGCQVTHFTNTLGMEFKLLPAGTFTMGSPANELGRDSDEGPQHQVTLSQAFSMQTTEVTQGQWRAMMGSNPSYFSSCGDDCPVEQVSWNDVQTFISALNQRGEGNYRLPTEAEWEYAARAGSTTAFANGGITTTTGSDPNMNLMGWYSPNSASTTHLVAQKQANDWGLYDMHGNVSEWVHDWYGSTYYSSGAVIDPQGPVAGSDRVLRGGAWNNYAWDCRSADRNIGTPDYRYGFIGFRLLRTP